MIEDEREGEKKSKPAALLWFKFENKFHRTFNNIPDAFYLLFFNELNDSRKKKMKLHYKERNEI